MAPQSDQDSSSDSRHDRNGNELEIGLGLLRTLLPRAMAILREGFGLIQLHGGDELAAEAALWSAWSSFQKHWDQGEFENFRALDELAGHLIRLAYNRWQRERRRQRKMDRAVEEGIVQDDSGQARTRDYGDTSPGPDELLQAEELAACLWKSVDLVKGGLSARPLRTVQVYLQDLSSGRKRDQEELARELGVHQTTVSRHLDKFFDLIRHQLEGSQE